METVGTLTSFALVAAVSLESLHHYATATQSQSECHDAFRPHPVTPHLDRHAPSAEEQSPAED